MSLNKGKKALTREKRLSALSHYNGSLEQLREDIKGAEIRQKIRTFSQVSEDEILTAFGFLSSIHQSVIIVHGAVGCAAAGISFYQKKRLHWYSTNLNERDTILGGDEKLRRTVLRAYAEQHPKVIFILGTPVVAINNDDVNSCILELEEELDVTLVSIPTDGFKTKCPATGYDLVLHALLHQITDPSPQQKQDFVNIVTVSEQKEDIAAVLKIFRDLKIPYQLIGQYSSIETIQRAGEARATVCLNPDEGAYFAEGLEEIAGVPYIRTPAPVDFRATELFIEKLAKKLHLEEKAQHYRREQEKKAGETISREIFAGKSVFLDTRLAYTQALVELVDQLGGEVAGLAVTYVDLSNRGIIERLDTLMNATPVVVANRQPFEKANILSKEKIDFYLSTEGDTAFSARQGSIPISLLNTAILGYEGITQMTERIISAASESSDRRVFTGSENFYQASWLKKSSNWYLKQEVK